VRVSRYTIKLETPLPQDGTSKMCPILKISGCRRIGGNNDGRGI
jgi:hypothetical protein